MEQKTGLEKNSSHDCAKLATKPTRGFSDTDELL
jgi:hypothetical protein